MPLHDLSAVPDVKQALLFDLTLGSDQSTLDTGTVIPAGFNLLEVWALVRNSVAAVNSSCQITVNGDTGGNYDRVVVQNFNATVTGSNTLAATSWDVDCVGDSAQAGAAGVHFMTIPAYADTTFHKVATHMYVMGEDTAADTRVLVRALRWRNTAAINRILFTCGGGGNFRAGSRLMVYGR